ncbi:MAG: NAD-dependent epimerase/dehydratase family protein [Thermoplasmata archaeon]
MIRNKNILITGGAGFIGSNLVARLIKDNNIVVFDNLSSGNIDLLKDYMNLKNFKFIKGDLLAKEEVNPALENIDIIFHLAANPDVRIGALDTDIHLKQNVITTSNLLEAMRIKDVNNLIFTSSSTVYGEAKLMPTPENYGPLIPISMYGASKLAAEAYITAYSQNYGLSSVIYRFANIVGEHGTHGVIYDFIHKLLLNPDSLEILGDGSQSKSYLYIEECIDAIIFGFEHKKEFVEIFNIGSEDYINVKDIASIVVKTMNLKNVDFKFTGGKDGRGWIGDIKVMILDISKIKSYGFVPHYNSRISIELAAESLWREIKNGPKS